MCVNLCSSNSTRVSACMRVHTAARLLCITLARICPQLKVKCVRNYECRPYACPPSRQIWTNFSVQTEVPPTSREDAFTAERMSRCPEGCKCPRLGPPTKTSDYFYRTVGKPGLQATTVNYSLTTVYYGVDMFSHA